MRNELIHGGVEGFVPFEDINSTSQKTLVIITYNKLTKEMVAEFRASAEESMIGKIAKELETAADKTQRSWSLE